MRCQFCGWDNPETTPVCSKCGQPLANNSVHGKSTLRASIDENNGQMTQRKPANEIFNPKATVRETGAVISEAEKEICCPACGIEIEAGSDFCPSCGVAVECADLKSRVMDDPKKTVRPQHSFRFQPDDAPSSQGFKLSLISNDGSIAKEIEFSDQEVILNRDNTEPDNNTITSQAQATIKYECGVWTIADNSMMLSTYVQASQPVVLHDGTLILLGDRIFKFEETKK